MVWVNRELKFLGPDGSANEIIGTNGSAQLSFLDAVTQEICHE
jgi:hypothetical protein